MRNSRRSGLHMDVSIRFVGVFTSRLVWYSGVWWITWQLKSDSMRFSSSCLMLSYGYSFINGATGRLDGFSSRKQLNGALSVSYSILLENIISWVMLMNRRNFLFGKRSRFIRLLSATIPPWLFGFFTSTKQRGKPLTNRVMSGRNSSWPFLQVNSALKWNELFCGLSKSISRTGETVVSRL